MALKYDELDDAQRALVKAEGVTADDFNALAELDQQGLLVDSSESDKTTGADLTQGDASATPASSPAPTPTPAPTAAPGPSPAPTPAPSPEPGEEDDPDGLDSPESQAEAKKWKAAPAATPAPTEAPAASPAPTTPPAASPAPTSAPAAAADDTELLGMPLPKDPAPPPQLVTAKDVEKRTELKTKRDELFDKFADGHLTKEEYTAQVKPVDDALDDLNASFAAQKGLDAQFRQQLEGNWNSMVAHSFATAKEVGLDYAADENLKKELDTSVRRFAQAADLMHPKKPDAWRSAWALVEAHKEVAAAHGKEFAVKKAAGPTAPAAPAASPAPTAAPAQRAAPNLNNLPPTTRGAPPAAESQVNAGEFEHLDGMDPFTLEKTIAAFPPDKLERYLGQ
jgi:hypothetical protein